LRVVIVEDEYRTRVGLVNLIQKMDPNIHIVGEAENGYEGVRIIQNTQPDVVFTDIKMPLMDGLKMIEELNAMNVLPKIILLTGYSDFEYAQKAIRLKVVDYLLKPVSIDALKGVLQSLSQREPIVSEEEKTKKYSEIVQGIVDKVKICYAHKLSLNDFAEQYHLTLEYLSSLFAKETGQTFSGYLKMVRLEEAKRLLAETELKIYEIAYRVGYPDPQYFSKVFREYTGVSAKQYSHHSLNEMEKKKNSRL
jgi:two-component system response regulator YesN